MGAQGMTPEGMPEKIWIKVEEGHHQRYVSVYSVPATEHTEYLPASHVSALQERVDSEKARADAAEEELADERLVVESYRNTCRALRSELSSLKQNTVRVDVLLRWMRQKFWIISYMRGPGTTVEEIYAEMMSDLERIGSRRSHEGKNTTGGGR